MIRLSLFLVAFLFSLNALADRVTLTGNFTQGGLVIGQTEPGAKVVLDGEPVTVSSEGRFLFGFGRDFKDSAVLDISYPDGQNETKTLSVTKRDYQIERVDGLPPSKVTPSPEFLARIRKENAEIARIRALETPENWFLSGWQWPAKGRVSGVYGSQRVLNDIPKRPHFGLDIAAPVGTSVVASTDGMVRMAEADLFYTGGTVMIDHGYGLVSVYSHLSKIDVVVDQFVRQGEKIGEIGATGRATGPHLDWRLNWLEERLDPELLLGPMPAQ
ncbi:M23 family metallopeptidase [uncultured Sneathiella sp.]|jgi:murein DD-endopeptidase MepM/ murein hydrolase activator NlpD|uniref:M23 family metallopeptidase n=1 Tax=uncultured Sneathiella sp. TaxID=879315 RepID=UPI0030D86FE9|tara:strand:- start:990 stop:1805 length:816 start_codon:yes stop_codon:yes gene_type:complete